MADSLEASFVPPKRTKVDEAHEFIIEKPKTDHREYRYIELANGLRAIVISDCKCDKSAAALSVKVGSLLDPKEVQGLAHFCEHMLFLGTKKYPQEDEYNEFLAKHGGGSNAYTANNLTNFYFSVSPDHLEDALDRFAQFFLEPLFTESATGRELQAVDSEHSKNCQSDMWRWQQLLKNEADSSHPLSFFGTGNSETLKVIPEKEGHPVRERLLEFHKMYYSANLMCLSVLGKQSLDELTTTVQNLFGSVVNNDVKVPAGIEFGGGKPPFTCDALPRLVRVVPVRDMRRVDFQFILPQEYPMAWRTRPSRYVSFLIGHEGEGSILSVLKAENLATELMAGPSLDEAGVCIFGVSAQLTEEGTSKVQRVGELIFAYIRLLQAMPVDESLWREKQCIQEMNFQFRSLSPPVSAVSNLTHAMQDELPVDKVLSGPAKAWDLDKDGILAVARSLTCKNLRLLIATKAWKEDECAETERWYGTKYSTVPLPEDWHTAWEAHRKGPSPETSSGDVAAEASAAAAALGLRLPAPNPFVPEDLELKPRPKNGISPYPVRLSPLPPVLASHLQKIMTTGDPENAVRIFFRQDGTFDLPKVLLQVEIYCPACIPEELGRRVLMSAWSGCVNEELNELTYDAHVAGLSYHLQGHSRGMTMSFGGYQDKLPVLLKTVADKMVGLEEVSEHTFGLVHTVLLRSARQAAKNRTPYAQGDEWINRVLSRSAVTSEEMLAEVEKLTCDKLKGFNKEILESFYVEALVQGNYTADDIDAVFGTFLPVLGPRSAPERLHATAWASPVHPAGSCVLLELEGTNPDEKNGAVVLSLRAARDSLQNMNLVQLVVQALSHKCFDELRTKQQLGYIVSMRPHMDPSGNGFIGLSVVVQSEKHPPEVHRRIEAWLQAALNGLLNEEEFTEEKFAEYHDALLTLKREKFKRLQDEFAFNMRELQMRTFRFTRREESIAFLERPRAELLAELRAFVRERLLPAPRICAEVLGATAKAALAEAAEKQPGEAALPTPSGDGPGSTFEGAITGFVCDLLKKDESRPYEPALRLRSLADVEQYRKQLVWVESITEIGP